jgi:hypothetical protein
VCFTDSEGKKRLDDEEEKCDKLGKAIDGK